MPAGRAMLRAPASTAGARPAGIGRVVARGVRRWLARRTRCTRAGTRHGRDLLPLPILNQGWKERAAFARVGRYSPIVSSEALPPAAVVLMVSVRSPAKRSR